MVFDQKKCIALEEAPTKCVVLTRNSYGYPTKLDFIPNLKKSPLEFLPF